jgi:hypothetical protein
MNELSPQELVTLNTIEDIREALSKLTIGKGYLLISGNTSDGNLADKYYFVNEQFQPKNDLNDYVSYKNDYDRKYTLYFKKEATGGTEDSNTQNIYIYSLNNPDEIPIINLIKADNGITGGGKRRKTKKNKKRKSKKSKKKKV